MSEEFLRPAGFSVDPRIRAHADTDTLSYVPPEDPVVSTRDTAWQSLPVPELGRYRCSREGLVYYSNRGGPGGFGYAICLQCGRAEARSEEHTSELQSLMRISYAVFCLKKTKQQHTTNRT